MRVNYSIIFVSDMERSVAFYRDTLGIPLRFESPGWTEFETEGATIALHKSDKGTSQGEAQQAEQAGTCRAGFQVSNLDEFHDRMTRKNAPSLPLRRLVFGLRSMSILTV